MQDRKKYQNRSDVAKQRWVRDDEKEAFWRKHVQAQKRSGISKRGYCKANNLPEASFYGWVREIALRDREKIPASHAASQLTKMHADSDNPFVPLRLLSDAPENSAAGSTHDGVKDNRIEIHVPGGAVIQVNADCNVNYLAQLFCALKS